MRRLWALILILSLLTGCAGQGKAQHKADKSQEESNKQWISYVPDSTMEIATNGAVLMYEPGAQNLSIIGMLDTGILVTDGNQLRILNKDDLLLAYSAQLPQDFSLEYGCVIEGGYAYYQPGNGTAVFLDAQLQQTNSVQLPALNGKPVFNNDGNQIFYCDGQNLYALDVAKGINRLVRSHSSDQQTLLDGYFDGKVLACQVTDEANVQMTIYLSAETGETLWRDDSLLQLVTDDENYIALCKDGTVRQIVFGTLDGTPQVLDLGQSETVVGVPQLKGAMTQAPTEAGINLAFYRCADAARTASVQINGVNEIKLICVDKTTDCIWLSGESSADGEKKLLCWNLAKSPAEGSAAVTPVYTETAPDKAGLDALQDRVDELNSEHGVAIRIYKDAVNGFSKYALTAEYQTVAIDRCLNETQAVLEQFPSYFLYRSVETLIRICIVREIRDELGNGLNDTHFWYSGNVYILLTPEADIPVALLRQISYVVDTRVLGNSPLYDYWEDLNPQEFQYGQEPDERYLSGVDRAFVSADGALSSREDRCQFFVMAMLPDCTEIFESDTMQAKLRHVCLAIRDAYRLEKKTDIYLWEQYLKDPVAYQKNA